jgi:hypothetical protein
MFKRKGNKMNTDNVMKTIRHYKGTTIATIICIAIVFCLVACESQVQSLNRPGVKVNRAELKLELDGIIKTAEYRALDLDKQDALKVKLSEIAMVIASGGTVNPIGAGIGLLAIMGVGTISDNSKKDGIIKTLQNKNKT